MIRIDGSTGEGGGQMLRTALSLSLVTGQSFQIENIRARRERAGLLRQHLTAVLAAKEVGTADVIGAELGSKTLIFTPRRVRPGEYRFAVGTAGSATLVFQTVLPALMTAETSSRLLIEGGTHNQKAPPFDFLEKTFLPTLEKFGPRVSVRLERFGFYPAGGGSFSAEITPCAKLARVEMLDRGTITRKAGKAIVANLSRQIAQREVDLLAHTMGWNEDQFEIVDTRDSAGPGNIVLIEIESDAICEVFSGFGRIGASAEKVATEAAGAARSYLVSDAVACEHLTDQLLLPMALAGGGVFAAEKLSMHARTNIEVIAKFLPAKFSETRNGRSTVVEVAPGA